MAHRGDLGTPYEVASLIWRWGRSNFISVKGSLLRNSGTRWQDLSAGDLFAVIYAEFCAYCGGGQQAEKVLDKWREDQRLLEATHRAAERAARSLPGRPLHDEVAWADADRRALANFGKIDG